MVPAAAFVAPPASPVRTPDGHPDLQGEWANSTLTHLERPMEFADKPFFDSLVDAIAYQKQERARMDAENGSLERKVTGELPDVWAEDAAPVATRRTSLLIDPADGKVPLNHELRKAREARANTKAPEVHLATDPEALELSERCLAWGLSVPMLPRAYNNVLQIVQTPDHVMILAEMIHDARVIPISSRGHLPNDIRRWQGDSVARWDGDTLVVDTTNFTSKTKLFGPTGSLHVVERLTRTDADTLTYQFTVENPDVFSRPWTAEIPLQRTTARMYEYACHEANYSMEGMLRASRSQQ